MPLKKKIKTEAQVTAEIKFALAVIGLEGFEGPVMKHWSGMGSRKGVTDLIGTLPPYGRALWIEIKRPGREATETQNEFMAIMKKAGGIVGVVRSVPELRDLLLHAGYKAAEKLRFAHS